MKQAVASRRNPEGELMAEKQRESNNTKAERENPSEPRTHVRVQNLSQKVQWKCCKTLVKAQR